MQHINMTSMDDFKQQLLVKFNEDFSVNKSVQTITESCVRNKQSITEPSLFRKRLRLALKTSLPVIVACLAVWVYKGLQSEDADCILEQNDFTMEVTRPLFKCKYCENLRVFPTATDLDPERFEQEFAYTGVPVVVRKGASNWTALDTFSVQFFREIYTSKEGYIDQVNDQCQFLAFLSKWETLGEALNMSRAEETFTEEKWYFGWYVHPHIVFAWWVMSSVPW